jgi:hypothetical protein
MSFVVQQTWNLEFETWIHSEKSKTPKSPKGDFEKFIDFQRVPLQGLGVRKLKINELRLSVVVPNLKLISLANHLIAPIH